MVGSRNPWLLRATPENPEHILFCFPYAGVGASAYRRWPASIGGAEVCAVQPPGRENRFRERPPTDHRAFAEDLVESLDGCFDQPFSFAAHCGGVPFAIEVMAVLEQGGLRMPDRLYASSWGAPDAGLYGRLNFVDLESTDLLAEVRAMFAASGAPALPDLMELVAGVLRHDLGVQRGYVYSFLGRRLPCPVTAVGWDRDDIVPPGQALKGWERCADTEILELSGGHFSYFDWPSPLATVFEARLVGPDAGYGGRP